MFRIATVLATTVLGVLGLCPAAHAYAVAHGTGARTASVAAARPLTVTGTRADFPNNADPGDPPVPVTATLSNPNGYHVWAHTVTATFLSSTKGSTCPGGAYRIDGSPRVVERAVAPGNRTLTVSGLTVALVASKCKGSTVTLAWTVN